MARTNQTGRTGLSLFRVLGVFVVFLVLAAMPALLKADEALTLVPQLKPIEFEVIQAAPTYFSVSEIPYDLSTVLGPPQADTGAKGGSWGS